MRRKKPFLGVNVWGDEREALKPEELSARLSKALKGHKVSEATRLAISKAKTGKRRAVTLEHPASETKAA